MVSCYEYISEDMCVNASLNLQICLNITRFPTQYYTAISRRYKTSGKLSILQMYLFLCYSGWLCKFTYTKKHFNPKVIVSGGRGENRKDSWHWIQGSRISDQTHCRLHKPVTLMFFSFPFWVLVTWLIKTSFTIESCQKSLGR